MNESLTKQDSRRLVVAMLLLSVLAIISLMLGSTFISP